MDMNDTRGILEARIRQMADGHSISMDDFDPSTQEAARKEAVPEKRAAGKQRPNRRIPDNEEPPLSVEEYERRFFASRSYGLRISFSMNRDTLDILRKVLHDMESRTTLSSFIENILLDHLQTYRTLINRATADKIRKPTIPNI